MTIAVLLLAFWAALVVAGANAKLDRYLAYMIATVFIGLAASIGGGRDHGDYETLIDLARSVPLNRPDLLLLGRIDPLFTLLVHSVANFTDSNYPIFFLFAFLGVSTKLWLSSFVPGYRALFIASYALLLAPWLEFAAIRAAVAVGFVGIAFMAWPYRTRIGAAVAACLAHISAVLPSALALGTSDYPSRLKAGLWMIAACVGAAALSTALSLLPRASTLLNNAGTVNSLFVPIAACLVSMQLYPRNDDDRSRAGPNVQRMALAASVILGFSAGITLSFVTVAYRMLEIAFFLASLSACIILTKHPSAPYRRRLVATLRSLIVLLCWMNYRQDIWSPLVHS